MRSLCVSKSSIFICVVGSNAIMISDHQIHVDSDDKGRDLKGWKGRKLRIPHENFATCICFFNPFRQCRRLCFLRLFYAHDARAFIAPPPTPYGHKHTYGHILCKYKLLFLFAHGRRYVHICTTREAPASVRYEFPVCHIVLWTSLLTVVSRQPASRRQSDTGFSKLRAAGAQYCFFVRQTVAVAWPALFVCSFSKPHVFRAPSI